MVGARIEFFDARKTRSNRWFFEIYIQGSKYNFFRAESENNDRKVRCPVGEFQLSSLNARIGNGLAFYRLIKLQRAHNGCLGANRR
jgi:hypothetical protein